MSKIPDDPYQRRVWLSRWAEEQRKESGDRGPLPARIRLRIDRVIERGVDRLDPLFDRGLNTSGEMYFPKSDQGGVVYVPGPTPWHILPRALRRIEASERDVFVDLGC